MDMAWASGIIEGEGTIIAHHGKLGEKQIRLAVEMTDLDILERLKDILGDKARLIKRNPPSLNLKHRDRYILTLSGTPAISWLMTIYGLLGIRRRKAVLKAITLWKTMRNGFSKYSICAICGEKFLIKRKDRNTLCGNISCHTKYGFKNANHRWEHEGMR